MTYYLIKNNSLPVFLILSEASLFFECGAEYIQSINRYLYFTKSERNTYFVTHLFSFAIMNTFLDKWYAIL